jgi:hypothetical protein
MSKKIYFLLIVVILLLIVVGVAGFLFWQKLKPTPIEDFDTAKISPRRNFEVKEEAGRKVIENKKDGLRFSVPQDWILKEDVLKGASDFMIYSPDAEVGEIKLIITKGCKVSSLIAQIRTDIDKFEAYSRKKELKGSLNNKYERVYIGENKNYQGINNYFDLPELNMFVSVVDIPFGSRLYEINLNAAMQDKERCLKEFDEILKTVSIKKKLF